ncbi:hypothetical protein PPTG_18513 [Phytophthora nicotianae INRA-310]|uniref:Uncharacterized protein n=1 Tax=Phytophthora nicotianae (strain INRA-310) TaxID=761204 RepID=W2PHT2_PHYN3|nr:hypothetical protein PPTG_18513 [Phytophthora nicotianae INRA-310]ETM99763.1 hypothetical protein PPTG_18513 [Phytophthora nicotianae INRA-310]
MVFMVKKHIVDSSKPNEDRNTWLQSMHDKTAMLLIYDYGVSLGRKQDRQAFWKAAEVTLREVVGRLQDLWGATYTGEAVVWRMWATEVRLLILVSKNTSMIFTTRHKVLSTL